MRGTATIARTRARSARTPSGPTEPAPAPAAFDPADVDIGEGHHTFRHDPLDGPHRALLDPATSINGQPIDWALAQDPALVDTLVAVRTNPDGTGPAAWFQADRRLREETFHSPLAGRAWLPDTRLVRTLLRSVPYVVVRPDDGAARHAFDVRCIEDPRAFAASLRHHDRDAFVPASGAFSTEAYLVPAISVHVPFDGGRYDRSTRKRFKLAVPGSSGDATVEGVAARVLSSRGYSVEAPHLLVALYRMLVGEPMAGWWRKPLSVEHRGNSVHEPPDANPLEATRRARAAVQDVADGAAPGQLLRVGTTLVQAGKRPETYLRYIGRLVRFAEDLGPAALAGILEGTVRGHRAAYADLVATHRDTGQAFLVEVKSRGDRLRASQVESALWHARDGRCGYRIMKVDHPRQGAHR